MTTFRPKLGQKKVAKKKRPLPEADSDQNKKRRNKLVTKKFRLVSRLRF